MYGPYNIPMKIEQNGLLISFEKEGELFNYKRKGYYEEIEKVLVHCNGKILINPIEPLNRPEEITSFLLIELEKPLVVEPGTSSRVYIKFPIEIGIFITGNKKSFEILDIVTLVNQKFTLYGDPRSGIICKYWNSRVYASIPDVNPILEGVMELNVNNTTTRWVEVTKAVFNAYDMRIYYNDELVSLKGRMKILGEEIAETDFENLPLKRGMTKSIELYTARKVSVIGPKFVMEGGL